MAQPRPARTPLTSRPPRERALAWLYTGPLGHLWGAVADISLMWVRWKSSRLRARRAK